MSEEKKETVSLPVMAESLEDGRDNVIRYETSEIVPRLIPANEDEIPGRVSASRSFGPVAQDRQVKANIAAMTSGRVILCFIDFWINLYRSPRLSEGPAEPWPDPPS